MEGNGFIGSTGKASLNDNKLSAHPEEKEYLLTFAKWKVSKIEKETLPHRKGPMETTVISLD